MRGVKGAGVSTLLAADTSALEEEGGKLDSWHPHVRRHAWIFGRELRLQPSLTYAHADFHAQFTARSNSSRLPSA
jgi:hypothetical protein